MSSATKMVPIDAIVAKAEQCDRLAEVARAPACFEYRAKAAAYRDALSILAASPSMQPEREVERIIRGEVGDACYDDIRWRSTREVVERCVAAALAAEPTIPEGVYQRQAREVMNPESGGIATDPTIGVTGPVDRALRRALSQSTERVELLPEGMVRWNGGDSAPADWDGGPVLQANGVVSDRDPWWNRPRSAYGVIAYTPKPSTGATAPIGVEQREVIARIIDPGAWTDLAKSDAEYCREPYRLRSLAKADANLATLSPPSVIDPAGEVERAWREGWALCKASLTDDEAFCLTDDVEQDAWLDSETRASLQPHSPKASNDPLRAALEQIRDLSPAVTHGWAVASREIASRALAEQESY